jgi:hypothetical protein
VNEDGKEMSARQAVVYIIVIFLVFVGLLCLLCWAYACGCPRIARPSATHYAVDKTQCTYTPEGACVLLNHNIVSDSWYELLDAKITATEACLKTWYATKPDVLHRVYNWKAPARSCYVVYVPDDWRVACEDPDQQVYGKAPQEACEAKGFEPKEGCECGWRTNVQDGSVIVTTPNLYLVQQSVIELLTGYPAYYIWKDAGLVACMGL